MSKYFVSVLILFILDRFTKIYALKNPSSEFWGGFFDLHINQAIAFSLPMTYLVLYPIIILILLVLFWFWKRDWQKKNILIWPWGLVIIGAVSNLLDRIQYGGVIDFINIKYFTIFNLSDIYISIGVVWLLWYEWLYKKTIDKNLRQD
ncbi:MAG: signal peptidase II [Patescibacteria group bacterium]|jgi:signal peptidase II